MLFCDVTACVLGLVIEFPLAPPLQIHVPDHSLTDVQERDVTYCEVLFLCVGVCVCVCARARARVHACVSVEKAVL